MRPEDRVRVLHMIEAAEAVGAFTEGRRRSDLDTDRMLVFALARAIEVLGEAGSKVSRELRDSMPAVPWIDIVAMRNRLIHAYFDIDLDILWHTAIEDIPTLLLLIRARVSDTH
jgi:uncharacterized protein with HEPN domain